ncbi:MAG: ubiquinol-cytochrome C chaperone [Sphingomonas sp.]|nr:ubiquinol-cytochrome C chaperone [Sphingomonas sp.]
MGLFDRFFGTRKTGDVAALYAAIVDRARQPHWYLDGAVPDTMDGRFDMVAAILSLVLIRLEANRESNAAGVALTESFITDMDAQLRESGIGDVGLGKHVGNMVSMLGGRLTAYRTGLDTGDLDTALVRNLYRGVAPGPAAMAHVRAAVARFAEQLQATPAEALLAGRLP